MKFSISKKTKRLLVYAAIIGGCAVFALSFYTASQYNKAKHQASEMVKLTALSHLPKDESGNPIPQHESESEVYWWYTVYNDFVKISKQNSDFYVATAIPAYVFSMATLVSFGLVLKHADKAKEKEEEEV